MMSLINAPFTNGGHHFGHRLDTVWTQHDLQAIFSRRKKARNFLRASLFGSLYWT